MAARRNARGVNAEQLGFEINADVGHINLYDHLTPKIQELLYKGKQFKSTNGYKYCWVKNGRVLLRKTDDSSIITLKTLEDLEGLATTR